MMTTRVILLLDLDCFYAQCERVRLGLDAEACSLALLQWNSTLAVTYPARRLYGIKRGDSWQEVEMKSQGQCLGIHIPVLQSEQCRTLLVDDGINIEMAYDQTFNLPLEEQRRALQEENGRQRFPSEGKSCLERYRLASTRIFAVVLETLEAILGRGNFILERASIDELFLDVTNYCLMDHMTVCRSGDSHDELQSDVDSTVVVGDANVRENDRLEVHLLRQGCQIAKKVRQSVFEKLGFTLSVGISTSKLVAKLAASYGKPNGQAVIYSSAITYVMNETPIRKVRYLGGKIGKTVLALLPKELDPTMGNLRDYISLPQLANSIGSELAQRVFDSARGKDEEEVIETAGTLAKSITAFKAFYQISIDAPDVRKWLGLLAADVVRRVEQDMQRNARYPKSCSVQYVFSRVIGAKARSKDRTSKSVRVLFPKDSEKDKGGLLATHAYEAIVQRQGSVFLHRIGLCAIEFESRKGSGDGSAFFKMKSNKNETPVSSVGIPPDEEAKKILGTTASIGDYALNARDCSLNCVPDSNSSLLQVSVASARHTVLDCDLEYARKLQASFDRENSLLTTLEKRKPVSKRRKIDSFFQKLNT